MTTSAWAVADEIRKRIPSVRGVKLQKLLYYAQGHHLATFGVPLFSETISAWDMGPVVSSVWHGERDNSGARPLGFGDMQLGEAELNTIGYVLSRYGGMTGQDLIRLSHGEPPWLEANEHRAPRTSVKISTETMRTYFLQLLEEDDESGSPIDAEILSQWLAGAVERSAQPSVPDTREAFDARRAELAR